jgi:hypothetical protein
MSAGAELVVDDMNFGGISESEIMSWGQNTTKIDDDKVRLAELRVRKSGVLERLAEWRRQDNPGLSHGGRPALVSDRAVLVGLVLLAGENSPQLIRTLALTFQHRLTDESRALLALSAGTSFFANHAVEHKRWYNNTHNAFHRMLSLMDPFPQSRYRSLSYAEVKERLDAHDPERELVMKARLDDFTNDFLRMTFNEQPRHIRRMTKKIDISFDQTYIKPPTQKGFSKKTLAKRIMDDAKKEKGQTIPGPVDVFAGWYPKAGNHPDYARGSSETVSVEDGKKKGYSDLAWGWTANIAVRVDSENPTDGRFPHLAISATLSQPNINVSEEAVSLMRYSLGTGLEPGVSDADKAYFANAKIERLHGPTSELGFLPSTDYRVDKLGVQGGKAGAEYIEGGIYCPGMPSALKNATKDLVNKVIDEETYHVRRKQRTAFQLRLKEKPDAKGRAPRMCPALGKSPTVTCPIREMIKERDRQKVLSEGGTPKPIDSGDGRTLPAVDLEDTPDILDKICQQHSVSFEREDGMRQKQAFDYMSPEWDTFHTYARNTIESLNNHVKDHNRESIEDSTRRLVRGFAAAQLFVTILLTNYNLRMIAAFLRKEATTQALADRGMPPAKPIVRRRDREYHNPYTGSYPSGVEPYAPELVGSPLKT